MEPISSHRGAAVVLLLLTVPILEGLRRIFGSPPFGDARGWVIMGTCALAIAAAVLLVIALLFHMWPFG